MLRVATFNVNGIRASLRRGFGSWLAGRDCDIVALQEVRCPEDQLPPDAFGDYHASYHCGELAGRNGVALLTRRPPVAVRHGFGSREFDGEGRYLEADVDLGGGRPGLRVASLYLPKGGVPTSEEGLSRLHRKMRFCRSLSRHVRRSRREAARERREFVVMGDWNIAPTELDLKNYASNRRSEGFLPEEREWIAGQVTPRTLVDVVRHLHPRTSGPYSWWSWRGQAFTNDVGWRIDYQLASPPLAKAAVSGGTDRDASYAERLSDHAPVVVDYAV
jgi:exodeoxyribonuclease-3